MYLNVYASPLIPHTLTLSQFVVMTLFLRFDFSTQGIYRYDKSCTGRTLHTYADMRYIVRYTNVLVPALLSNIRTGSTRSPSGQKSSVLLSTHYLKRDD